MADEPSSQESIEKLVVEITAGAGLVVSLLVDHLHRKGVCDAGEIAEELRHGLETLSEEERHTPKWYAVEVAKGLIEAREAWSGRMPTSH